MLIEFAVTNYRSFRETQKFSMVSGPGTEHVETHTFESGISDLRRLLRSAAVYGANAAGKTNLLRAIQFMQNLVINSANLSVSATTPYDPFKFSANTRDSPSEFEIAFIQDGVRYEYGFAISPDRIEKEWLIEYPRGRGRRLFERQFSKSKNRDEWKFSSFFRGNRVVWSEATRSTALFLSTAVQLNSLQLLPVAHWFQKQLVVIVGATTVNQLLTIHFLGAATGKERLLSFIREADPGIADVDLHREPLAAGAMFGVQGVQDIIEPTGTPGTPPNVVKITFSHLSKESDENGSLDFKQESNGTQVLFRMAGAWLNVLANGEVFLIDEIETSLHPLLTRLLIEYFHSDVTNPNNAQLIFTTHNTSLLNQELFRRDQIWFVEKTKDGGTTLFPLTDFSPRNDEAIERGYLRGRYGALPVLSEFLS